jgi:phage-related minor tail protein
MNTINPIDFGTTGTSSPSAPSQSPFDQELATLEKFIDKLATAEKNMAKSDAEAGRKKAELLAEYEKKLAYLTGLIHKAQSELAALQGSQDQAASSAVNEQVVESKRQDILFWSAKLRQLVEGCNS